MSRVKASNRLTKVSFWIPLFLLLGIAGSAYAQPAVRPVMIRLAAGGSIQDVIPYAKAVCPQNQKVDCGTTITWRQIGAPLSNGWSIEVRAKTTSQQPDCWNGATVFVLTGTPPSATSPVTTCTSRDVWEYDVIVRNAQGAQAFIFDPIVVIDN